MQSFGLWYEPNYNNNTNDDMKISLHVNLWSLEDIRIKDTNYVKEPFLDIGIKIESYRAIDNLIMHCPFIINPEDIIDLSPKLLRKENASIIFNRDCEITTKDSYTIVEINKSNKDKKDKEENKQENIEENIEELLIFPLDQPVLEVFSIQNLKEIKKTNLVFDFTQFREYVDKVDKLKNIKTVYIRFRIKTYDLKNNLYFDSELRNKSFESAFSGTRIIDFKVNEKRNIDTTIKTKVLFEEKKWVMLEKVHYLLMIPSSYDVVSFSEKNPTCRELESDLWDDYLDVKIDFYKNHVLVYHWVEKGARDSFSCLAKIKYSKSLITTILKYCGVMLFISIAASVLASMLISLFT